MNRNLFGLIVMLGIVMMIFVMAACESKSGKLSIDKRTNTVTYSSVVKIVLIKRTSPDYINARQFKVRRIDDSSVYFWTTQLPYDVGDTVSTTINQLRQ